MREVRQFNRLGASFFRAVAGRVGMNATDLQVVDILDGTGPVTAGQLAELTGLTTGAIAQMLKRRRASPWLPPENAHRSHRASNDGGWWPTRGGGHGMLRGMKTTMDAAGRLVIPRQIRQQAGLAPGLPLDIQWRDDHIEIHQVPLSIALRREGRFVVAAPASAVPPLTVEQVEATRGQLLHERGHAV